MSSRREIGKCEQDESNHGDGKLLHGCNDNSTNNGDQSHVNWKSKFLSQKQGIHQDWDAFMSKVDPTTDGNQFT